MSKSPDLLKVEELLDNDPRWKVVTARRQGEKELQLRFVLLNDHQVPAEAQQVAPNLEDAYLALIARDRQAAVA